MCSEIKNVNNCAVSKQSVTLGNNMCITYISNDSRQRTNCNCIIADCRPVIIAIPDIGADGSYWTCLVDKLSGWAHVFSLDLPIGSKFDTITAIDPTRFSQYLTQFLTRLNIAKVYLVGHGYGAQVVIRFARLNPSKVIKVVAASLNPAPYLVTDPQFPFAIDVKLRTLLNTLLSGNITEATLQSLTTFIDPTSCAAVEQLLCRYEGFLRHYRSYLPLLQTIDTRLDLNSLTVPVLLTNGTLDPFTPHGLIQSLTTNANISIVQFTNQGHNYPILDSQTFNSVVHSFLFVICEPCTSYFNDSSHSSAGLTHRNYVQKTTIPCAYTS